MNQREQNLATLKDYCARMIKGDFSALEEIMSPDWFTHASPSVIHEEFLGVTRAHEGELVFFRQVTGAFKAPELLINKMMAIDDDHVVLNYTITGVHSEGKFFEVPPSGKRESLHGTTILRFKDGQIVEHWGGPHCQGMRGYSSGMVGHVVDSR